MQAADGVSPQPDRWSLFNFVPDQTTDHCLSQQKSGPTWPGPIQPDRPWPKLLEPQDDELEYHDRPDLDHGKMSPDETLEDTNRSAILPTASCRRIQILQNPNEANCSTRTARNTGGLHPRSQSMSQRKTLTWCREQASCQTLRPGPNHFSPAQAPLHSAAAGGCGSYLTLENCADTDGQ
jgi:hypothetical protein